MLTCSGCGFEAPPDFAFCPKCGRALGAVSAAPPPPPARPPPPPPPPAVPEADRRLATILFADLTGFTSIAERLDPEEVRALQTDLFDALRTVLEAEQAFVEKFVGDAVMAVFGAPVAHEDDAERALRSALAMHEQAARLSERWRDRIAQPLSLHIGVNSGRVVAGHIGSAASAAYAVTGDAVNVAARLQAAAAPGGTLVSADTHSLARAGFEFEAGGEVALKGKAQPLTVFRLLRSAARAPAAATAARFVGRERECAALHAAFTAMQRGAAQVVFVEGDAGSGKSRLVDAFADDLRAAPRPPTLRRTRCAANETRPYGAIARFFRDGFGLALADDAATVRAKVEAGLAALGAAAVEVALVVPMAGYLLGLPAPDIAAEPERLQRQIDAALRILLEHRLRQGPLVLVVEDVQWADAASLAALATMADWLHDRPLLLVLSCRAAHERAGFSAGRAQEHKIVLEPLARAQAEELLAAQFGAAGSRWMPAPLRDMLLERAGGNPYFLEALVRGLVDARVLVDDDGAGWRCDDAQAAAVQVPATLEGLLLARLDRLAPRLRQCLQEASVLGASFDAGLLRELSDAAHDPALLDELAAQGHIARAGESATRWRFCALLARDVVYGNLLLKRRVELHGRVARLLEARRDPANERFDELQALGEHFCRGDDALRGARYLALAGDWARAIYANDDALGLYRRAQAALAAKPQGEDALRADVVEAQGDLLALDGRRAEAFAAFDDARVRARALGEPPREARIERKRALLHWDAGARDASRACLDAGLALLDDGAADGRDIESAHLLQELGRHAFRTGDNDGALRFAERALADARRCADAAARDSPAARDAAAAIAQALNTRGAALARLERPQEAVAAIEESIAVAEAHGMLQAACRGYANLGVLYASFNPGQAIATCRHGLETATRIGDLGFQSRLYANLAVAYCALTNQCDIEGLHAAEAAIELDRRLGQLDHLAVPLIVLAQIHQCHGDPQQALRYYGEACELAERIGEPQLLFPVYDGLGTLYLDLGDVERAEGYLTRANEVCDAAGLDRDALVVLPFLC